MKSFETWRTWLIIIGLVLFSAIASLIFLSLDIPEDDNSFLANFTDIFSSRPELEVERESDLVTIDLGQYLIGDVLLETPGIRNLDGVTVHPLVLIGILTAIVVGALVAATVPLALILVFLGRQTVEVKADPDYQEERGQLQQREKERLKERNEVQPTDPMPSFETSIWTPVSQGFAVLLFVVLAGLVLADTFFPSGQIPALDMPLIDAGTIVAGGLGLITLIILFAVYARRRALVVAASEDEGVPWGMIWVVISGLIFLGIGVGLMLVVRSGAGG